MIFSIDRRKSGLFTILVIVIFVFNRRATLNCGPVRILEYVRLLLCSTGRRLCKFEHETKASLRVCQFSPDARMLATGSDDETLALWDMSQRKYIR